MSLPAPQPDAKEHHFGVATLLAIPGKPTSELLQRARALKGWPLQAHTPGGRSHCLVGFTHVEPALRLALEQSRAGIATAWSARNYSETGSTVRGHAVERALALAHSCAQGVAMDARSWHQLQQLPDGCSARALGGRWLTGLEAEIEVHQLHRGAARVELGGLANPSTNLEAPTRPFCAPQEGEDPIAQAFDRGARIVALTGPPGVGKTRQAVRHAGLHMHRYGTEGGVWWCATRECRTLDRFLERISSTLGIPLTVHGVGAVHQLGVALQSRGPTLLVIDSAERGVGFLPEVLDTWSQLAPELRVLITSRVRMHRAVDEQLAAKPLDEAAAIDLFYATTADHIEVRSDTLDKVARVARRVDGLPLAVELSAAWADLLSLDQLLDRLGESTEVLARNPDGEAAIDQVMQLTWSLLEPWERHALCQCSVFRGGFTLEAAERVLTLPPSHMQHLSSTLRALHSKSVLRSYTDPRSPLQRRFALFDVIRDYAARRLPETGLRRTTQALHAHWAVQLGEELAEAAVHGEDGALGALTVELDNLLAVARPQHDLPPRWSARALLCTLPLLAIHGPYDALVRRAHRAALLADEASPNLASRAHRMLARALLLRGRPSEALEELDGMKPAQEEDPELHQLRAEALYASGRVADALELADDSPTGAALRGRALAATGDMPGARKALEQAVDQLIGARSRAEALADLGNLERAMGAARRADQHYRAALALYEQLGDRPRVGQVLGRLGSLALDLDRRDAAREHLHRALQTHREVGDRRASAITRGDQGRLHHALGAQDEARQAFRSACQVLKAIGERRFHALFGSALALVEHEGGQTSAAARAHAEALETLEELGDVRFATLVAARMAAAWADAGRVQDARAAMERARASLGDRTDPIARALLRVRGAHLSLARGETQLARRAYQELSAPKGLARVSADLRGALRLLAARSRR